MAVEGNGMCIHALLCNVESRDVLLVRFREALALNEEGELNNVPQVVVAIYAGVPELTVLVIGGQKKIRNKSIFNFNINDDTSFGTSTTRRSARRRHVVRHVDETFARLRLITLAN